MGTQNKEIKIALDIQAKIDKASNQINTLKKQIDNFELSKGLAGDFAKEFKNIEHELAELQRRTASGEINLIDAKAAEKEIDKIEKRWAFLLSKIGGEGFLEKGLKTDAQAIAALESLAQSYAKSIKEAELQESKLNKRLEEAKQHQKELNEAQKEQKVVKASELEDQKAQLALLQQQEKAAKKARDDAEKVLRTKVEESGGKYSMDQASQKGSPLRKTDAYRTFREAQSAYETAKANTKTQKTNVGSIVTKEMQVAEATAAKEAIDKATEALENYRKTVLATAKEDAFEKAKESLKSISEFKDINWEGLNIDLTDIKSVEDLEKALAKLRIEADKRTDEALKSAGEAAEEASNGFRAMGKDIKGAKEDLQELDEQAKKEDAFEAKIKQFLGLAGATEILRRSLRNAFNTTKELDAAMTEMAVVTDLEVGDYWEQLPEHTKRASELGVAIKDVYEAETLYYQQGLKTAEAQALANETLKMARIAGLNAADATDKMTAALRGFNMELNEASAQKVSDVYSELAAITAADVNEISSAMTKTASIASSAGMEFETTAAFLSQIIETTRESAETAGTAMKTVIARFSEVKKLQGEGLLTGQDEEGEVIDVNKIQTALRTVGISMDEFFAGTEGLDSIFLKLAEKWDKLDVKTQRYIATTAAGSRQQSRFIAMMSDYGRTQELVSAANNSAGASNEQYEKTLESLKNKLARLKAAWDEFSMGILQSDLVKFGVDVLTKFIEIINRATSAFSGLGGSITKVLTTIALFKLGQKIFDKIKKPFIDFLTDLKQTAYVEGTKIGEKIAEGIQKGMKTLETSEQNQPKEEQPQEEKINNEKSSIGSKILEKTGIGTFIDQDRTRKQEKADFEEFKEMKKQASLKDRQKNYAEKKDALNLAQMRLNNKEDGAQKEFDRAQKEFTIAEKNLTDYQEKQKKVQEESIKGWEQVGQGFQKLGASVATVGIGMSVLGSVLNEIGLEEFGEGVSTVGNILVIFGSSISALGSIIPIVSKGLVAAGISVQAAWWWVVLIVAAIALIAVSIKKANDAKLENRMKAAAEATEKAKEAAQEAKEAYDEMVEDRKGFDEIQKKLANLTRGTKEWKEALRESNALVLELIQTYPDLAQHLERGEYGQLVITDEGWDKMIENQEQGVRNAQAGVLQRELDQVELKREKISEQIGYEYVKGQGTGNDYKETDNLHRDLKNIYVDQSSSLEEQSEQVEILAQKYHTTTDEIWKAAEGIEENKEQLEAIAEESENIARAHLTTMASQSIQNSDFGDSVIDAFANSFDSTVFDSKVEDTMDGLKKGKDYQDSAEFKRIAKEYGVEDELSGNDTESLKTLYKAVIGVEADDDMKRKDMLKAIAEADVSKKLAEKMDQYLSKLEEMSIKDREIAAGMLSDDGRGITMSAAKSFMNGTELNKDAVNEFAEKNFGSIDAWADMVGKSVDELYNEIEKNIEDSIEINKATFDRLNKALGKSGKDAIEKIGNNNSIATENAVKLTDKLVVAAQTAGEQGGYELTKSLGEVLDSAGPEADKVASLIGSMSWSDSDSWDKLQDELDALNISVDKVDLEAFIGQIKKLGIVVPTVDFNKLSEQIQKMNELIKSIDSGEQGRTFSKESYEMLVSNNKELANSFVQIGDEFHYLGGSMRDLSTSLKQAAILEAKKAELQLKYQTQIANAAKKFDEDGLKNGEEAFKLSDGKYDQWSREEKIAYLETFRENFQSEYGDEATLSYLTDEQGNSLNLSLGTNFYEVSEQNLDQYLKALQRFANENDAFAEEYTKKVSATNVAKNLLLDSSTLVENAQKERSADNEIAADDYSKALSIQASQSGAVADSIISRYNELVALDSRDVQTEEELQKLEAIMSKGIEKNIANLEKLQQINGYTNQVIAALEAKYQKEIDKLSEVNDSINTANEKLVGKIQEQINQDRQDRDNAKKEEEIGKKQSQLAYLLGDTSGASMLQALALQEQITQEQEDYQDTLIDQGLQKLSDDNAAAAEQRERQIEMMQAALDYDKESGNLAREAENIVMSSLREINAGIDPLSTKLYEILYQAEEIDGKVVTQQQQEEFANKFTSEVIPVADSVSAIEDEGAKENEQEDSKGKLTSIDQLTGDIKTFLTNEQKKGQKETENVEKRKAAITKGEQAALGSSGQGQKIGDLLKNDKNFEEAYKDYLEVDPTATKDEFYQMVVDRANYDWQGLSSTQTSVAGLDEGDAEGWFDLTIGDYTNVHVRRGSVQTDKTRLTQLYNETTGEETQKGSILLDKEAKKLYVYGGSQWYEVAPQDWYEHRDKLKKSFNTAKDLIGFKTGGIADFTGPAWLDGTKSRPELVLNARDTENFIQLKDILSEIMNHSTINNSNSSKQDTNYIDIDINVDSIASDYDVEQMADKIRSMLYEDATYRNVNSINLLR